MQTMRSHVMGCPVRQWAFAMADLTVVVRRRSIACRKRPEDRDNPADCGEVEDRDIWEVKAYCLHGEKEDQPGIRHSTCIDGLGETRREAFQQVRDRVRDISNLLRR